MLGVDALLAAMLGRLGPKPPDDASQALKKRYSERVSEAVALEDVTIVLAVAVASVVRTTTTAST